VSKKIKQGAFQISKTVQIILAILGFTLLSLGLYAMNIPKRGESLACYLSVHLRKITQKFWTGYKPVCKPKLICLALGSGENCMEDAEIEPIKKEGDVLSIFAVQLFKAWDLFGKGEIRFAGIKGEWSRRYCLVYAILHFDSKAKKELSSKDLNLKEYLNTEPIPAYLTLTGPSNLTYAEYFATYTKETKEQVKGEEDIEYWLEMLVLPDQIDPNKVYYLIYLTEEKGFISGGPGVGTPQWLALVSAQEIKEKLKCQEIVQRY